MSREYKLVERLMTIDNLNLAFGEKIVLRDINLKIDNIVRPKMQQGQCVVLLGPSGIGKTQLFRCIAGMQRPTSGFVKLRDDPEPVDAGEVGVVQQSYPLLGHRTIMGNLKVVNNDEKRLMELLTHFGLEQHADKYPVQLSGGQRQRIAIIQQIASNRHFLLMDEPFSGLDVIAKGTVIRAINEIGRLDEENTTICTTHDLEAAVQIADTIWMLGREEGKPGATVVDKMDLIEPGIAWSGDVEHHPKFHEVVDRLKERFKTL